MAALQNHAPCHMQIKAAYLSVDRLAQLYKLDPGRVIQIHFLQEFVSNCLQSVLWPNLE